LRRAFGFHFIETDVNDDFIREAINSNSGLVARYLDKCRLVAVEWGFFPKYLNSVISLKKQGAKLLWFSCDKAVARSHYSAKWKGDAYRLKDWDDQITRIERAGLPTRHFQVVETFGEDRFRPHGELDEEILP
jgi:hypothetical protein